MSQGILNSLVILPPDCKSGGTVKYYVFFHTPSRLRRTPPILGGELDSLVLGMRDCVSGSSSPKIGEVAA